MKVKLLKKLRQVGRNKIDVYSITKSTSYCGTCITGMRYGYTGDEYRGLFSYGDTEDDVRNKASKIYLLTNINEIRKKYYRYSRNHLKERK